MTPPPVLLNSYVKVNEKPPIDCASKIFIFGGLCLGINRVPLLNVNVLLMILSFISSFVNLCFYFFVLSNIKFDLMLISIALGLQWTFIIVFNVVSIKRLQRYYNELDAFDKEVKCRPKIGKGSIKNLILTAVMLLYFVIMYLLPTIIKSILYMKTTLIFFSLCHVMEIHYYGHLLSLLIPRMRLINYYMELSLMKSKFTKISNIEEFGYMKADSNKSLCEMEKVMDLYHKMLKASNYLVEAVKWQFVATLISAFVVSLIGSYRAALSVIKYEVSLSYISSFILILIGMTVPWFSPCVFGDQVHYEVVRLRELLTSRIYENQLDKSCRCIARALLAWTKKRDLSFTLLRVLDIDISLPFKLVGLLITYLIILLQFQKIIDP